MCTTFLLLLKNRMMKGDLVGVIVWGKKKSI